MSNIAHSSSISRWRQWGKPIQLKRQMYANVKIGDVVTYGVLLTYPELMKTCILGVDILSPIGGINNLKNDTSTLDMEGKSYLTKRDKENIDYYFPKNIHQIATTQNILNALRIEERGHTTKNC